MTTAPRTAFSLLEVILALAIVALVLAAIAPALIGTLRAERQARRVLEPERHAAIRRSKRPRAV